MFERENTTLKSSHCHFFPQHPSNEQMFFSVEIRIITLRESNIAMDNGPFENVFRNIKNGDIPLLC